MRQGDSATGDGGEVRNALPAGTVLGDLYRIESTLGHGGFGIVYRARHRDPAREKILGAVAIKEYLPADLAVREEGTVYPRSEGERPHFEEGLRRFEEEARQLVGFGGHPNVVACRDYFEARGTAYLVMNYEEGLSLGQLLRLREERGEAFGEEDLLLLIQPLLDGLAAVHAAGVVHRDIKPSNVIVRRSDSQPVLIDFGAAKEVVALHSKSLAPFTPGYAAIEQVAGADELGPWTDMYGVGATMWRIVAGGDSRWRDGGAARRGWSPPNPIRVEARMLEDGRGRPDPLPSAREVGRGRFSEGVLEAIDRCVRLEERERVQSCGELRDLLRQAVAEEHVSGRQRESVGSERGAGEPGGGLRREASGREAQVEGDGIRAEERLGPRATVQTGRSRTLAKVAGAAAFALALIGGASWYRSGSDQRLIGSQWTNSIGMEFVRVPPGEFWMGSKSDEAASDERPVVRVRITKAFYLSTHEVTQGQWEAVMGTNPSRFVSCGRDCPVEQVSWEDVQGFIARLNEREGGYRLPTEAEWEYSARAGSTQDRYSDNLNAIAWYRGNSGASTHPVGQKAPNAFGLHDMLGNVWEWVQDWYGPYPGGSVTDPRGPDTGSYRVIRGGGWVGGARHCRASRRNGGRPGSRYDILGFRLLRTN